MGIAIAKRFVYLIMVALIGEGAIVKEGRGDGMCSLTRARFLEAFDVRLSEVDLTRDWKKWEGGKEQWKGMERELSNGSRFR
jgi:hypothetical protein